MSDGGDYTIDNSKYFNIHAFSSYTPVLLGRVFSKFHKHFQDICLNVNFSPSLVDCILAHQPPPQQPHANRRQRATPQTQTQANQASAGDQAPATQQQQQQRFQQLQQLQVQQQLQKQQSAQPVDAQEANRRYLLGVMWTTLKAAVPPIPEAEISERLKLEYARLVSVGQ